MRVRSFIESDKDDFLAMCRDFYCGSATSRGYEEDVALKTFEQVMSCHENLWGFMMEEDTGDQLIGYALITSYWCNEDGGNVAVLDELYIEPNDRHKGYAKTFMTWMEGYLKGKVVSITLEVLTTNTIAKELYAVEGYSEDGFEVLTKKL